MYANRRQHRLVAAIADGNAFLDAHAYHEAAEHHEKDREQGGVQCSDRSSHAGFLRVGWRRAARIINRFGAIAAATSVSTGNASPFACAAMISAPSNEKAMPLAPSAARV